MSRPRFRVWSSTAYEMRKCVSRRLNTLPGMMSKLRRMAAATNSVAVPHGAWEGVEGPFGEWGFETILKGGDDHIALASIGVDVSGHVFIECRHASVLQGGGSTNEGELLEFGHFLDDPRRPVGVAHPPAGHAVSLAEAVHHEDVFVPAAGEATLPS